CLIPASELLYIIYFFFSSRRRHTRSKRDWSSDVCSSDLRERDSVKTAGRPSKDGTALRRAAGVCRRVEIPQGAGSRLRLRSPGKIGRASCRERGEVSDDVVGWMEKHVVDAGGLV